jgi:hypothetical protein
MDAYYYSKMNKSEQAAYRYMKEGLLSLAPSFPVPKMDNKELADIFFKLRLDCPEIFWAVSFQYRFYPDSTFVDMVPEYIFSKTKIKDHQSALQARVARLSNPMKGKNEWEKEQYIHDFICENVHYDKLQKAYSHEIIGPLGHGVGVCEGIAKTVKILCDALGIWCMIVISDANAEKKIKYRHAWNIVKLGGKYYHLDATFDNTLGQGKCFRYDYMNLNDKQIFRDHEPLMYDAPSCSDDSHIYYKEKKMAFTKMEDIGKRTIQAIRKKKTLLFQWRGGYLTREVLSEILSSMNRAAGEKAKYPKVSLNWPQAVFYVEFIDIKPEEDCLLEQANEGEL